MKVLFSLVAGALAGALGFVTYPGPLDQPYFGIALGAALVGTGAWFTMELGPRSWLAYFLALNAASFALIFFPPSDDLPFAASSLVTNIWIVVMEIVAVLPLFLARRGGTNERSEG